MSVYLLPKNDCDWPAYNHHGVLLGTEASRMNELFSHMLKALIGPSSSEGPKDGVLLGGFAALVPFDGHFTAAYEVSEEAATLIREFDALLRKSLKLAYEAGCRKMR